ncbi:MAG: Rv3654c family TadE-like protein, partial [Nocardioidaceae bacterium]
MTRRLGQRGSATVLGAVLTTALLGFGAGLTALGSAVVDQRRAAVAADLGALAGASAAQRDATRGAGCAAAGVVVRRNGARLAGCRQAAAVVTITVERVPRSLLGLAWTARATARAG